MQLLTQFVFRLSFGLAAAMAVTPPRYVSSGYFRNNLYVLLGLNVLAALAGFGDESGGLPRWLPVTAAVLSYLGAVAWLYERGPLGVTLLVAIALVSWRAAMIGGVTASAADDPMFDDLLTQLDFLSSGFLLGTTVAAMLLGHWYLNVPGMRLEPLRRLVVLMAIAALLRGGVAAIELAIHMFAGGTFEPTTLAFLALRWLAGILGVAGLACMTWQTLKIPNTQSATGILYVAVIGVFIGELASQLLAAQLDVAV